MSRASAVRSVAAATADTSPRSALEAAIASACGRIAPLWPLESYVAVNPFLGFAGQPFAAACATLRRVAGTELLPSLEHYRARLADGSIEDCDLESALADAGERRDAHALRRQLAAARGTTPRPGVATVADVLDRLADGDRETSRTAFMIDEISKWCAAYFDEGEAAWRFPWRDEPLYAAWRAATRADCNPEVMGIANFRRTIDALPADALGTIETIVATLGLPPRAWVDYFHRALLDVHGWAAYARQRSWTSGLRGGTDDTLVDLLALRLAWGYALFEQRKDETFRSAWRAAVERAERAEASAFADPSAALAPLLQSALEHAERRRLLGALAAQAGVRSSPHDSAAPRSAHAVFCIDVRSEIYRRALETAAPDITTSGFAGFFGFALDYVPLGASRALPHCPVLLAPSITVRERIAGASAAEEHAFVARRSRRAALVEAWGAFARSAVSSFTYVETFGLGYAWALLRNSIGQVRARAYRRLPHTVAARTGPHVDAGANAGHDLDRRVALAEGALRGMGLTHDFARAVLLVGHGSTTTNNPHAASLNCGACGGRTGEANARFAAAVLNAVDVRAALAARGIEIPPDTRFVAALHDTTTDEVRLFDDDPASAELRAELPRLRERLASASSRARAERASRLDVPRDRDVDAAVIARSGDWSEVRPEWGLARNCAFVAAPRTITRGVDLDGRAFLHEYDWRRDDGYAVLELILTAPLVVATWINLQYYASAVDNRLFGCGNKTLHNVVGKLGVLEGNAGSLRVGLPLQSLRDGDGLVHEPVRLTAVVAAPESAIDAVLAKHAHVGDLVRNEWLHLVSMTDDGTTFRRRRAEGWEDVAVGAPAPNQRAA